MRVAQVATATMFDGHAIPTTAECAFDEQSPRGTTLIGTDPETATALLAQMRCALRSAGFDWPHGRITLNLSPAALNRNSCSSGLPLALALLVASGQIPSEVIEGRLLMGELMLSGELVTPSRTVRQEVIRLAAEKGLVPVLPRDDKTDDPSIVTVASLAQATRTALPTRDKNETTKTPQGQRIDFADLQGQIVPKKAAELAVLTRTPLLLRTRQPELADAVACRIARLMGPNAPFRKPHHSADPKAISGGGQPHAAGEVDLAAGGILYLADLDRFSEEQLAPIAKALKDGQGFLLVASAKPCPCANLGDPQRPCTCTEPQIAHWKSCLEGPLKGRFGLQADVADPDDEVMALDEPPLSSDQMADRIAKARQMAASRTIPDEGTWTKQARAMFQEMAIRLGMDSSERALARRLSRATADLQGSKLVTTDYLIEAIALQHRLS